MDFDERFAQQFLHRKYTELDPPVYECNITEKSEQQEQFGGSSEEAQSQSQSLLSHSQTSIFGTDHPERSRKHDFMDSTSYSAFEQLWIASKYHCYDLILQWDLLLEKVIKEECEFPFHLSPSYVAGILHLCKLLGTNHATKFRAIELFERYLKLFTKKMANLLRKSSKCDLNIFYDRFESQLRLRMCTCILIASKLHADSQLQVLSMEKIRKVLRSQDDCYSVDHVSRSELRVLETLDYRCHWATPLDLMEQLLCLLNLKKENLQRAHYFCLLLLEFCYTDLDNIRVQFSIRLNMNCFLIMCPLHRKSKRSSFKTNREFNVPLQCAAIVSAALFIVSAETKTNLHKIVAKTAALPEEDVHTLAILILDLLNG